MNERHARAFLTNLTEPGDKEVGRLVREYGAQEFLRVLSTHTYSEAMVKRLMPRWPRDITVDNLEHWFVATVTRTRILGVQGNVQFLIPGDAKWPVAMDDLADAAPFGLWVSGDPQALAELNSRPSVALVGARAATSYGEHVTNEFAADLAGRGTVIVSGAAYGIDGSAHRAAIAAGGPTIAFLSGGVDRPYPWGHADLIDRIRSTGAVVSDVPPGSTPTKWRFLARNRLIAAASQATVVVEAGFRSGSLNIAGWAQGLDRPLGAVPGPITSAASAGTHRIIREMGGALITTTEDIIELIGAERDARRAALAEPGGQG